MISTILAMAPALLLQTSGTEYMVNFTDREASLQCRAAAGSSAPPSMIPRIEDKTPTDGRYNRNQLREICEGECRTAAKRERKPFFFLVEDHATDKNSQSFAMVRLDGQACWLNQSDIVIARVNEGLKGKEVACATGESTVSYGSHNCKGE